MVARRSREQKMTAFTRPGIALLLQSNELLTTTEGAAEISQRSSLRAQLDLLRAWAIVIDFPEKP